MPPEIASADLELTHYSGATIPLVLETLYDGDGRPRPRTIRSALSAAVADSPLADWLEPYVQETWIGGCGGGGAKRGYTQAPGCVTRIGDSEAGFVIPGPAEQNTAYPDASNSNTPIAAIEEFEGGLYFAQVGDGAANRARVLLAPGGGASLADSLGGISGYPTAAGNTITDLLVFTDQSTGARRLYASGNDGAGARLHATTEGTIWASTASGLFSAAAGRTTRFDWLQKVFWRTANGDQAWRMVAGDAVTRMVSYTRPGADPMLAASWVLNAFRVDTTGVIRKPPAIRRRLYIPGQDGIFDVDELGDTPNVVPSMDRLRHPFNGYASVYLEEYIYFSLAQGLGRVYVGDPGLLSPTPGVCSPGAFTGAEHEYGGWVSCLTADQGNVVAATYNPNNGKCGIWWGRDRKHYPELETANPLVWWGPEIHAEGGLFVTAMRTFANQAANVLHLWVAASPYAAGGGYYVGGEPIVTYFTIPVAGQALSDYLTGGGNLFAVGVAPGPWQPRCELLSLPYTWADKASTKFLNDTTVGSRGLDVAGDGTNIELYTRADPEPGDATFGTGVQIGASPVETKAAAETTRGNKTQYLIRLLSPHGTDGPATRSVAVLDAVRVTAFRRVSTVRVLDVTVRFGHGIRGLSGSTDQARSVDDLRGLIEDVTEGDRIAIAIRPNRRYTALVRQVMDERDELISGAERATIRLQLGILAELA